MKGSPIYSMSSLSDKLCLFWYMEPATAAFAGFSAEIALLLLISSEHWKMVG